MYGWYTAEALLLAVTSWGNMCLELIR